MSAIGRGKKNRRPWLEFRSIEELVVVGLLLTVGAVAASALAGRLMATYALSEAAEGAFDVKRLTTLVSGVGLAGVVSLFVVPFLNSESDTAALVAARSVVLALIFLGLPASFAFTSSVAAKQKALQEAAGRDAAQAQASACLANKMLGRSDPISAEEMATWLESCNPADRPRKAFHR